MGFKAKRELGQRDQMSDSKKAHVGLPSKGCEIGHLQQREAGDGARVHLLHIVEQLHQENVSLAQPVANQVILPMALQHLVRGMRQGPKSYFGGKLFLYTPSIVHNLIQHSFKEFGS